MRAVSLFSGAGGFEQGFERAGIDTVLQCEIDPWAQRVLRRHWPETERVTDVRDVDRAWLQQHGHDEQRYCGGGVRDEDGSEPRHNRRVCDLPGRNTDHDVRDVGVSLDDGRRQDDLHAVQQRRDYTDAGPSGDYGDIDLVYGGFPCQPFSVAGKRAGDRDDRNLWPEFRRVVRELRPRWVVAENVPGILSFDDGRFFGSILTDLADLGFDGVAYAVLDAQHFGVPQRRRRVFVVAGPTRRSVEQVLSLCESCGGNPPPGRAPRQDTSGAAGYGVEKIVGTLSANDGAPRQGQSAFAGHLLASAVSAPAGHHGHSSPRGDGSDNIYVQDTAYALAARNAKGVSLLESQDTFVVPPQGVRRLTPLEAERLMAWPDSWTKYADDGSEIPDSHRYRMIGNGVVATVAEYLGRRLVWVDEQLSKV